MKSKLIQGILLPIGKEHQRGIRGTMIRKITMMMSMKTAAAMAAMVTKMVTMQGRVGA